MLAWEPDLVVSVLQTVALMKHCSFVLTLPEIYLSMSSVLSPVRQWRLQTVLLQSYKSLHVCVSAVSIYSAVTVWCYWHLWGLDTVYFLWLFVRMHTWLSAGIWVNIRDAGELYELFRKARRSSWNTRYRPEKSTRSQPRSGFPRHLAANPVDLTLLLFVFLHSVIYLLVMRSKASLIISLRSGWQRVCPSHHRIVLCVVF